MPMATIDAVFAAMPASSTRDHLALVAYAGLRPSEIARIQPGADVTRTGRQTVLLVRTAKGGTPSAQPLLPEAAEALERLQASGRLARYDSAVGGLALRRACMAAGVAPLRVYDLRHSFGTAVLQATDQRTAQAALRHASIQTTHRYTLSAVPERVAVALRLIGGRDTAAGKTLSPSAGVSMGARPRLWCWAMPSVQHPARPCGCTVHPPPAVCHGAWLMQSLMQSGSSGVHFGAAGRSELLRTIENAWKFWRPRRDSNPRFSLERAAAWHHFRPDSADRCTRPMQSAA